MFAASIALGQAGAMPGLASDLQGMRNNRSLASVGVLAGSVRDASNRPVKDARVEVRLLGSAQTVAAAYTSGDGQFEIDNLPLGNYEVVITHGLAQDRQQIAVEGSGAPLRFRLSEASTADAKAGTSSTVSVAEMKVPKKARQHFEKASEALKKQNLDEAAQIG
ncbi:MAG TPA: carboxypeptidase-like regulatory domain-containing protein, partial [Terriglobales bacterium]|nr:carboxypeptidase-like regulatory domain-containing protein [Terriglobales bacterium]